MNDLIMTLAIDPDMIKRESKSAIVTSGSGQVTPGRLSLVLNANLYKSLKCFISDVKLGCPSFSFFFLFINRWIVVKLNDNNISDITDQTGSLELFRTRCTIDII